MGYESNLNAASSSSDSADSVFGFGSAAIGVASAPARVRCQLAARWSGTFYSDFADLSVNRVSLAGGVYARLADTLVASVLPSVRGSFYGDGDRDSFDLAARFGLRWQVHRRLALRPGYTILWEDARASEFDRTEHRFSLGIDADVWRGGRAYAGYAVELGQVARYLDLPDTGSPGGGGPGGGGSGSGGSRRMTGMFGRQQVVVRSDATSHDLTLDVEQALTHRIFLRVGGGYGYVSAEPDPYEALYASGSLGVYWP